MEEKFILEGKAQIKNEVFLVLNFIKEERTQTMSKIKRNIKGRTIESSLASQLAFCLPP